MFGFRTRHLTLLKVAHLKVHLMAARATLAPRLDLLVDNNMARPVVSMDLLVVQLDPRVAPRHHSRSTRIVAC